MMIVAENCSYKNHLSIIEKLESMNVKSEVFSQTSIHQVGRYIHLLKSPLNRETLVNLKGAFYEGKTPNLYLMTQQDKFPKASGKGTSHSLTSVEQGLNKTKHSPNTQTKSDEKPKLDFSKLKPENFKFPVRSAPKTRVSQIFNNCNTLKSFTDKFAHGHNNLVFKPQQKCKRNGVRRTFYSNAQ